MKRLFKKYNDKGLTLVELLISVLILVPLFTISMLSFIRCMQLSDLAKNSSLATWAVKNRMTAIEGTDYNQIFNTYHNTNITNVADLNGIGKTYVDNSNAAYLTVTTSFSWRERNGRVIGEDRDLDGIVDIGEDLNGNGQLDSIVKITTRIYNI